MKKNIYFLFFMFVFFIGIDVSYAVTIRETIDSKDGYSTIEEGSIIIGTTKFLPDDIVTASKATMAGVNDAMLYVMQNGSTDGYENPGVYYYVDSFVGWFHLNDDNKAVSVVDEELLNKLSNLDIYYVNNVEKVLEIEYLAGDIDLNSLVDGVEFRDNKLFVNASISKFDIVTNDKKKVSYVMDKTTSQFVKDISSCYTVLDGVIIDYDFTCGSDIVIPVEVDGEDITGIGNNAFKNVGLVNVVIPNTINSIGDNAFVGNKLESVVIKDKYDKRDFSKYGDNVFGDFDGVVYDNELTKILNYVDSEYVINYYKSFDIDFLKREIVHEYGLRDYVAYDLIDRFVKNGYNYDYDYSIIKCNYEDRYVVNDFDDKTWKDLYGISLLYVDDYKYNFILEKYDVSENRVYEVSKIVNVSFNENGNKKDNDVVVEAIKNLKMDDRDLENLMEHDIVTRYKYLNDLEDKYDIDIITTSRANSEPMGDGAELEVFADWKIIFYLKNGILYNYTYDASITNSTNMFVPLKTVDDYNDDIDEYIDYVLEYFSEKTGVTNYQIINNTDGDSYGVVRPKNEVSVTYEIELIDVDFSEKWVIQFIDYYEDKYDSNGNTIGECFEFNDGVITDYDGSCGINVVIPNKINDVLVIEIGDNVFKELGIKSVILPDSLIEIGYEAFQDNKLTSIRIPDSVKIIDNYTFSDNYISEIELGSGLESIGFYAFFNNKIKNIEIPSNVKEIGDSAFLNNEIEQLVLSEGLEIIRSSCFANNKISSLVLPKTLQIIGNAVFNNNFLSDDEAFIYGKKYDREKDEYVFDYEKIVSYGGTNRDNVVVPNGVKYIDYSVFADLNINKINLPYGLEYIGNSAFAENNLTEIIIPETVTYVGKYAFDDNNFSGDNCYIYPSDKDGNLNYSSLIAYLCDSDGFKISSKVKKIWPYAVYSGNIENFYIPYGVLEIGDYAFNGVVKEELSLPKSVIKLGKNIFGYDYGNDNNGIFVYARDEFGNIDKSILMSYVGSGSTTDVIIPDGVVEIRENVFSDFYNLKEVVLPSSLMRIGDNVFRMYGINELEFNIIGKDSLDDFDYIGSGFPVSNSIINFKWYVILMCILSLLIFNNMKNYF